MIVLLGEFPDNVVAVRAHGLVTGEDYTATLVPAVERKIREHDQVRLLYQIGPDFKRFTTTALWEDAKVGFHHLECFERIAVVTDVGWLGKLAEGVGLAMSGRLRVFPLADFENAAAWISEI
jgi:hypothetical protein